MTFTSQHLFFQNPPFTARQVDADCALTEVRQNRPCVPLPTWPTGSAQTKQRPSTHVVYESKGRVPRATIWCGNYEIISIMATIICWNSEFGMETAVFNGSVHSRCWWMLLWCPLCRGSLQQICILPWSRRLHRCAHVRK